MTHVAIPEEDEGSWTQGAGVKTFLHPAACLLQAFLLVVLCASAAAQIKLPDRVTFVSASPVSAAPGASQTVKLEFRVVPGFHINSHKPNSDLLVPTVLSLEAPTDILIGKIDYPPGIDASFAFAPSETLNVYAGKFAITAQVTPARTSAPGKFRVHGALRYQACNDRACFPPKTVPAEFDVAVQKAKKPGVVRHGQSPHIHN